MGSMPHDPTLDAEIAAFDRTHSARVLRAVQRSADRVADALQAGEDPDDDAVRSLLVWLRVGLTLAESFEAAAE